MSKAETLTDNFDSTLSYLFLSLQERTAQQVYPVVYEGSIKNNGEVFYYQDEYFNGTFMLDEANNKFDVSLVISKDIDLNTRAGVCSDMGAKADLLIGDSVKVDFNDDFTIINIKSI